MRINLRPAALALVALAACDPGASPPDPIVPGPSFAQVGACAPAGVTVSSESGLNAALAATKPGDVIGIKGTVVLTRPMAVTSPEVTLTCAAPGAGLRGAVDGYLLEVSSPGVSISSLALDATSAKGAVQGTSDGVDYFGDGLRLTGNTVSCGTESCILLHGVRNALVADNDFTAMVPTGSGVHLQGDASRAVVTGNTVTAKVASTLKAYGGIRVRDAVDALIQDNVVTGPWANGLAVGNLFDATVARNRISGAVYYGIVLVGRPQSPDQQVGPFVFGAGLYSSNDISGAGEAGMYVVRSCGDAFRANRVSDNPVGALFEWNTGANVWLGNAATVSDLGAFDCDDDGTLDPNAFTGNGLNLVHVPLGQAIKDLMSATGENIMR